MSPPILDARAFGWVWDRWVELLRAVGAAQDRADAATDDRTRFAAEYALEAARYDLETYAAEVAEGFRLGLKLLGERHPAALRCVFSGPLADLAGQAVDAQVRQLRAEVAALRAELAVLRRPV